MVIGQHHAHYAEPEPACPLGNGADQEVRRGGERAAEMMLAEEDALEAQRLVARPQVEIARDVVADVARRGIVGLAAQLGEELEQPGFDHCSSPAMTRFSVRKSSARLPRPTRRSSSRSCVT